MPGKDGTGPMGQGALTGRGLGPCGTGSPLVGRATGFGAGRGAGLGRGLAMRRGFSAGLGLGFRRGFGRGAGFGRGYWNYGVRTVPVVRDPVEIEYTKQDEIEDLKSEKEALERELKAVEQRIKELK